MLVTVSSIVEELLHHISISMARKVEVTGYSINFEPSHHPASFIRFELCLNSAPFFSSIVGLDEGIHPRQVILFDRIANINLMNLQDVLNIQTEHRARIFRELYIDVYF